ncbi:PepSY-associated TM helix domain-containing protein [Stenotrophobium rhamnosiphilum]|uniref:PepSY domain-containing protein n=1 Tax=Stenotrophobium rhamnosiphilum TaxID=2029166 RepID=A0A2T5MGN9_9GAMM|nr:PepSY-associated TM helix domain-containing protein [Stenotrophobium rhamnosiphilum]PTU31742.1 PepSY domain-containing protein [Stenotrophobium rhamnosiphilum]
MIELSKGRTKELLAIHGWSGVFLGLLLYVVILTGSIAVFEREISQWSAPLSHPTYQLPATGMDGALRKATDAVDPKFHEDIFFFSDAAGRIRMFLHMHDKKDGKPEDRGVEFDIDPKTMAVLDRREGWGEDIQEHNMPKALADFFVELHVSLHLPDPWGLLLTGVLGLAMLVAAVTGFLVHRHLIRELFTLRRKKDVLLTRRDAHVVAGTWNLPFSFILAFTGSYFSFASAFAIPAMAMVAFGGDQEKLFETVIGAPAVENKTPSTFGDIDKMIADVRSRSGAEPGFVSIEHFGRADAQVTISTLPPEGKMVGQTYLYKGDTAGFIQQKPALGVVPSLGNDLFVLMAPLHFGNFAGLWSKVAWFALGFAGAYVTLTGMLLWTTRRADQPGWAKLARASYWVGYGLPLALAAVPLARFIAPLLDLNIRSTQNWTFIAVALLASIVALLVRDLHALRRLLLGGTGVALLLMPLLRWLSGGPSWAMAFDTGLTTVIAFDITLIVAGVLCVLSARRVVPMATAATLKVQAA